MTKEKNMWKVMMLVAVMLLGVAFGYERAEAGTWTLKSGDSTYTAVSKGGYPGSTTIYRTRKGSSRQKIAKVSGTAIPKGVFDNKLYYTKDRPSDSMMIDLWSVGLKSGKKTLVRKNSEVVDHYGRYYVVKANSGDVSPMNYYLLNVNTGRARLLTSKGLMASVSKNKVYYVEATSGYSISLGGWKVRVRSCNHDLTGKKTIKSNIITVACYEITSTYVVYSRGGKFYKYTYETKKTRQVQMVQTDDGYYFK